MYIYILFKLIFEFFGKKFGFRFNIFYFFELLIIFFYLYLLIVWEINFSFYLFIWCCFWLLLFVFYRLLNFILLNFKNCVVFLEGKEKLKAWLLKPVVCKSIYYLIWMLPWNLPYWVYFWIMENGWYFRVWICSNRDIFFKKYFGWDSREFFYNLNKILFENFIFKFMWFFFDEIIKSFFRLLIFISFFRKNLLIVNVIDFFINRIFIFCYLSIFYLFFFESIQLFNKLILLFILFIEFLFIIFFGQILKFILFSDNKKLNDILLLFDNKVIQLLIDPLTLNYYIPSTVFFEVNNTVWNIILGNSVSLDILRNYIIWVDKNTYGFFFKKMNIFTRMNIINFFNLSSLPWDVLPKTTYVIFQLYYINNTVIKERENSFIMPDYRIRNMKNLYLSYFEKTYAVDSSLLSIIFLLRTNVPLYSVCLQEIYKKFIYKDCDVVINYILLNQKSSLWRLRIAEICMKNSFLLNSCFFFNSFKREKQLHDIEDIFMFYFFFEKIKENSFLPVISFNGSILDYKKNIELLSHFILYEEEAIVWNDSVISYLQTIKNNLQNDDLIFSYLSNQINLSQEVGFFINIEGDVECFDDVDDQIKNYFKIIFSNDITDFDGIVNMNFFDIYNLNLKIISIKFNDNNFSVFDCCLLLIKDLEELSEKDIENSAYYFLFENK